MSILYRDTIATGVVTTVLAFSAIFRYRVKIQSGNFNVNSHLPLCSLKRLQIGDIVQVRIHFDSTCDFLLLLKREETTNWIRDGF